MKIVRLEDFIMEIVLEDPSPVLRYLLPTISSVIIIINIVELYTIFNFQRENKKYAVPMVFFLNLAIADLLSGIFIILSYITENISTTDNNRSTFIQFSDLFVLRLYLFGTVLSFIALVITRLLAVVKPPTYRQATTRHAQITCICIWFISLIFAMINYCVFRYAITDAPRSEYILFPIVTYTTLIFCCICYYKIKKLVKKQKNFRFKHQHQCHSEKCKSYHLEDSKDKNKQCKDHIQKSNNSTDSIRIKIKEENASFKIKFNQLYDVKLLMLIGSKIAIFMICWLPLATYSLLLYNDNIYDWKNTDTFMKCLFVFLLFNSFINPVVFFIFVGATIRKKLRYRMSSISKSFKKTKTDNS